MRITSSLLAVVLGLAVLLVLLWLGQRRLMYFPYGGPLPDPAAEGLPTAAEVVVATEDGLSLGAWFVEPARPESGWTLILFNGNAGHRAFRAPLARRLSDRGLGLLMLDYRGYGGNPGSPSEDGLLRDARAARRWLDQRATARPTRIGYFGESLGTGVAVALAAERAPDALILRSPFTSMVDVARYHYPFLPIGWLLSDRYPSEQRIRAVRCPTLVIAAERDSIVPAALSRRLFEAADPVGRRWFEVPGADHNDWEVLAGDAVVDEVVRFLQDASRPELGIHVS